jgi:energy-coupling factor transporter ATP-binding protein EcfA2
VIELAGLQSVAKKRVGNFSLGMGQRLGITAALLGDPATIMLDEPGNGLDPESVLWIRTLLTELAADGRTVFVSSHLMSEIALVAEHLIIVGRGGCSPTRPCMTSSGARAATPCTWPRPSRAGCATSWPDPVSRSSVAPDPKNCKSAASRPAPAD